eukprot:GEMP01111120.1.p1 GENE.GEMP01111120.1~~GEMP01111120.1.p1  ORF type:complete len:120 (+),score=22.50 GEMP01111120.1:167-526(+)
MIHVRLRWLIMSSFLSSSAGVNGNMDPPSPRLQGWQGPDLQSLHASAPIEEKDLSDDETVLAQVDQQAYFMHYNQAPRPLWGLPKIVWVIVADVLAMTVFLTCIPVVLSCAKRRRPMFR